MQKVICKALNEGRLAYKVLDQNFQSCNSGTFDWRPYLPTDEPGKWLPEIKDVRRCESGYHFTLDPLHWPGFVVFLVELTEPITETEKQAFSTGRLLKRVWPDEVIDVRLLVRVKYPFLRGADLQGADLRGAYLWGAYLRGTYLRGADLRGASRYSDDPAIPGWKLEDGILIKE